MNKLYLRYAVLSIKQNLMSPAFYMLSVLLILGIMLTSAVMKKYTENVPVLFYDESDGESEAVIEELCNNSPEGFVFLPASSKEALINQVTRGEVSCGFVFQKSGYPVELYKYAGSADAYVVKEYAFSVMQNNLSDVTLGEYLDSIDSNIDKGVRTDILKLNREYIDGIKLDIFRLINISDEKEEVKRKSRSIYINGIIVLLLFIISCADTLASDKEFFHRFKKRHSFCLKIIKCSVNFALIVCVYFVAVIFSLT